MLEPSTLEGADEQFPEEIEPLPHLVAGGSFVIHLSQNVSLRRL